jgi:hypothetical protein
MVGYDGDVRVEVSAAVIINRSCGVVAEFASDPLNQPRWQSNCASVSWLTPPPMKVGSRFSYLVYLRDWRRTLTFEIVEYVPGKRLTMRCDDEPRPGGTAYTWTTVDHGRTRMTARTWAELRGFEIFSAPFRLILSRRGNELELLALKDFLERRHG